MTVVWGWRYSMRCAQTLAFRKENTQNINEKHRRHFSALPGVDKTAKTQNMTTMWHVKCKIDPFKTLSRIWPVLPRKHFPSLFSLRCFLLFYIFSFCTKALVRGAKCNFVEGEDSSSLEKKLGFFTWSMCLSAN